MPEDFTITLEPLTAGKFGLTKVCGSFLAEAAAFCLYQHKHAAPVVFTVRGDVAKSGFLVWDVVTEQHRGSYADLPEATEWGACGIAILVATRLTGIQFVQRSVKGAGVDYWLGDDTDDHGLFQRKARLEVSGILEGGETQMPLNPIVPSLPSWMDRDYTTPGAGELKGQFKAVLKFIAA
jgi:hypothetical protein